MREYTLSRELDTLVKAYHMRRGQGHTTALRNGVLNTPGTTFVVACRAAAPPDIPRECVLEVSRLNEFQLYARQGPLVVDHAALVVLLESASRQVKERELEYAEEISDLRDELQKTISAADTMISELQAELLERSAER